MSWLNCPDPVPGDSASCDPIDTIIVPRTSDLGGFSVRRALPSAKRRMVGPFIFFDQMGPAELLVGAALTFAPIRISVWQLSLICSKVKCITVIVWVRKSQFRRAR